MSVETNADDLISVIALLGAGVIAVPLFKRLGLGSVLGYLFGGLIIGPFGLGLFENPHDILHIAELGVVMFLFVIGLEMKPSHLWGLRHQIFGLGSLQVLSCGTLLTGIAMLFNLPWQVAFIAASGFVLTSTAIVMQVLSERGETASPRGQKMISVLLFEDLLIVPLLAIVSFLAPNTGVDAAHSASIWQKIGIAGLSLAILIAAGLWLLNPFFKMLARSKAREVMTAAALLVVLGAALLMELGGFSMAMGAFVAGVLLSESSFRHQLEADIEPFRGLLLGLFFLGVGMALDLHVVAENWLLILGLLIAMMLTKALVIYVVARLTKSSHIESMDRAVLMAQGGEFAFVLYAAAASQDVIDSTFHANMTAVVVLSMALTPIAIIALKRLTKLSAPPTNDLDNLEEGKHQLRGNVLIIGFGRVGQIASQAPIAYGAEISIIDNDPSVIRSAREYGFKVYYGDGARADVLRAAGVENVQCVIICIDNADAALRIVENIRHICSHVKIVARAIDRRHAVQLDHADVDYLVRETFDASIKMGNKTLKALGATQEQVEDIERQVRLADNERYAHEIAGDEFAGQALLLKNIKDH